MVRAVDIRPITNRERECEMEWKLMGSAGSEADLLDMMRKRLYWTTRAIEGECVVDEHGVPVEGLRIKRKGKRVRLEYEA